MLSTLGIVESGETGQVRDASLGGMVIKGRNLKGKRLLEDRNFRLLDVFLTDGWSRCDLGKGLFRLEGELVTLTLFMSWEISDFQTFDHGIPYAKVFL